MPLKLYDLSAVRSLGYHSVVEEGTNSHEGGFLYQAAYKAKKRPGTTVFLFPLGRHYSVFIPAHQANLTGVTSSIGAKADYAVCLFSAFW